MYTLFEKKTATIIPLYFITVFPNSFILTTGISSETRKTFFNPFEFFNLTLQVMFSSGNEGSFSRENALKNTKSSSFGITKEFLVSYLYGKNNIKTVDRKQLVEETAAKRGLQESSYRQHKSKFLKVIRSNAI